MLYSKPHMTEQNKGLVYLNLNKIRPVPNYKSSISVRMTFIYLEEVPSSSDKCNLTNPSARLPQFNDLIKCSQMFFSAPPPQG